MATVGAFEAKTRLSELLDQVERGEEIVITRHGEPIARLIAVVPERDESRRRELLERMAARRSERRLGEVAVRELIEEGRRF